MMKPGNATQKRLEHRPDEEVAASTTPRRVRVALVHEIVSPYRAPVFAGLTACSACSIST